MTKSAHTVEIDRLVLSGLELTPEQAGQVRSLLEAGLGRRLMAEGWPDHLTQSDTRYLQAPSVRLSMVHSPDRLAEGLTDSLGQTLHGAL